jgi:hypothetical protein
MRYRYTLSLVVNERLSHGARDGLCDAVTDAVESDEGVEVLEAVRFETGPEVLP